jgi:hypothetical protein
MKLFNNTFKKCINILLPVLLGLLVFYNISYTDDIHAYYDFYTSGEVGDYGFKILQDVGHYLNLDFLQFENLTYFLILLLFSLVFYKYRVNTYLGICLTILLNYVQIANQLRYFLAVPILLLSFYYFFISKKRFCGVILAIIAFLFHSGVIAWVLFIPLSILLKRRKTMHNKLVSTYIAIGIAVLIMLLICLNMLLIGNKCLRGKHRKLIQEYRHNG